LVTINARPITVDASLGREGMGDISARSGAMAKLANMAADEGFTPLEFMDAALSGCLVLSVRIAARKAGWLDRLEHVDAAVTHEKAKDEPSRVAKFLCDIKISGDFTPEEHAFLIAEAHRICTVGNTFEHGAIIQDIEIAR